MNTPRFILLATLLAAGQPAGLPHLHAQTPSTPVHEIGSIPPVRVWYSELARVDFVVRATAVGDGAALAATYDATDGILGPRTFDAATGRFVYVPDPADSEPFTVTFQATKDANVAAQTVIVTPLRPLPPESAVFGLEPRHALPLEDSRDFTDVSEKVVPGSTWFNAVQRPSLREITIVGKSVVFEEGHANELWNYHANADIRSIAIHAETVIFRNALHLPQAYVSIFAAEVRFEDQAGKPPAGLSTIPLSSSAQPAQYANGRDGHNGGSLTLFVDAITGAGSEKRFLLDGGNGERAGQGSAGAAGADRSVIHSIANGVYRWTWDDDNTIYAHFDGLFDTEAGSKTWPGDGGPARAGGRPGIAGDGGAVVSNLSLAAVVATRGGIQGTRATTQPGGRAGRPTQAWRRYYNSSELIRYEERFSSSGASAAGPNSAKTTGLAGAFTTLPGDLRWLDPLAMQKVLLYLNRAFLAQHFDYVRENVADYVELLELAMQSTAWAALSADARASLAQILDELRSIRHRVDSNLDYFGNPAGWVPMLSFEVNKLAFDNEIPRALRLMYLNYWLGNRAQTIQQKQDAMVELRRQLREQIVLDRDAYNQAVAEVPGLKFQAAQVQDEINLVKTDIESLKNDLLQTAKNIALLKKTARALAAVAEVVPVGQPYVGAAGQVIGELPNVDPDRPWTENVAIIGTNVAGETADSALDDATLLIKARLGLINSEDIDEAAADQTAELRALQAPLMDLMGESLNQMRTTQHPSADVEAELQRLLADEPAFKVMQKRMKDLNRRKQEFAVKLASTMQSVVRLSLAITRNLITIDRLNRGIQENALTLNPETLGYLAAMNERARDRLLKYHYFMARAFEYRMLQPYEGELDLNRIFDKFAELATAGSTPELTADQFDSLRAIYEDQVSSVAFAILDQYNSNRPTLSAPVRLVVSQGILDAINAGDPAAIDLAKEGLFLPDQENVRIVNLKVLDLDVTYTGSKDDIFYADVVFQHSGESRLQKSGETYLFRHYSEDTRSKIEWTSRFDPYDSSIDPVQPSAADQSLLKSLLSTGSSSPSTEDLLLYSRPAADAELLVTKQVNARAGAGLQITRMRIELQYDFSRMSDQIKTLNVDIPSGAVQPKVRLGTPDRNGRQDGEGDFERSYNIGQAVVVEAEERIGQYRFDHWEGDGFADATSARTTVSMNASRTVRPIYRLIVVRQLTIAGGTGSGSYENGTVVPIAAIETEGHRFVRWNGSGVANPTAANTTVTVNDDATITAIYESIGGFSALVNISNRAVVGTGDDILIPGFVIVGTGTKRILVRAVGPTLEALGVTGVLADPTMTIYKTTDGVNTVIASNDNWGAAANAAEVAIAADTLGAFPLPQDSTDAALLLDVGPGVYSVVTSGVGATTGVGLVEVYDADAGQGTSRLVNISGRARVGVGDDILIPGFVVSGNATKRFLIRAVGPGLVQLGVTGVLPDPQVTLYRKQDGGDVQVGANDNWSDAVNAAEIAATADAIGAFPLPSPGADAVLLVDLEPGVYTAVASGVGATTGVALVEVYEVTE